MANNGLKQLNSMMQEGRIVTLKEKKHDEIDPGYRNAYQVIRVTNGGKVALMLNLYSRTTHWVNRRSLYGKVKFRAVE